MNPTKLYTILSFALCVIGLVTADDPEKMTAIFVNEHPRHEITVYWVNPDVEEGDADRLRVEATLPPRGGSHHSQTFEGHEFYYEYDGTANYVSVDRPNRNMEQVIAIGGREGEGIRVRCEISTQSGKGSDSFDILVQPYWAPRGAVRFLELVRVGLYNGVVLNRVVPKFLTQFGIAKDYEMRTDVMKMSIWDDFNHRIPFEAGYVSFAGSGHDSRTSEIFIVMPDVSKAQLENFGENSWETPFGFVEGDLSVLNKIYSGYGDMPPWGKGPDSQRIYDEDGYTNYLPQNYPKLDSITSCYIVEEAGLTEEL